MKGDLEKFMREDIYYCECCNTLRDKNHNKVSQKYCMKCNKKTAFKAKKIQFQGAYGQFCPSCYGEIRSSF
ncbi:hypothetical protein BJQ93_01723 [Bacillus subtilis]|nr:hypothetical protein [Bacillus subtilis]